MKTIPCKSPFVQNIAPIISRMIPYDGTILTYLDYKHKNIQDKYAVFNMEDLRHKTDKGYLTFLQNAEIVYDYSLQNIDIFPSAIFCPFFSNGGSWTWPNPIYKDIDVLFYGYLTQRRKRILDKLDGFNVVLRDKAFGQELQQLVDRSKVVLSLGAFDNRCNDGARVIPALEMGAKIVAEQCQEKWFNDYVNTQGVEVCEYDKIISKCKELIR